MTSHFPCRFACLKVQSYPSPLKPKILRRISSKPLAAPIYSDASYLVSYLTILLAVFLCSMSRSFPHIIILCTKNKYNSTLMYMLFISSYFGCNGALKHFNNNRAAKPWKVKHSQTLEIVLVTKKVTF